MNKSTLILIASTLLLSGCSWDELTSSSGGGSSESVSLATDSVEKTADTGAQPTAAEPSPAETTASTPPAPAPEEKTIEEKPPEPVSKECGVGRYAFRTDSDGKFHFDAIFESGGLIRYNFSVKPNTGRWRISEGNMIFNGPFAAGHSDHVSTWKITSRAADCSVLQFRGKSYGRADVTASRL
jgi:hypothetical protein